MEASRSVRVVKYAGTIEDAYGNETPTWAAPVDADVYAWSPAGQIEVNGWRHTVTADLTLYTPRDFPTVDSRDRVEVAGETYDVEGLPEDYTQGPFPTDWDPGLVVNLKRRGAT